MGHLEKFRVGWENEHLATFLLSRISFVASPVKIGDDVGTDLFCTLFEIAEGQLFPRNSFAIQVKSSKDLIEATGKIEHLRKLELPFFVGVVDQGNLTLSIYSGEYLPILFEDDDPADHLWLSLSDTDFCLNDYREKKSDDGYILRMPYVLTLEARQDRGSRADAARKLADLCSRMHRNISSRVGREYIFELGNCALIMAGPGSAQTFRRNFYLRLAEVFRNLELQHQTDPNQFPFDEYEVFEDCYLELQRNSQQIPSIVEEMYQRINRRLTGDLQDS
jgi:hypothetical protein